MLRVVLQAGHLLLYGPITYPGRTTPRYDVFEPTGCIPPDQARPTRQPDNLCLLHSLPKKISLNWKQARVEDGGRACFVCKKSGSWAWLRGVYLYLLHQVDRQSWPWIPCPLHPAILWPLGAGGHLAGETWTLPSQHQEGRLGEELVMDDLSGTRDGPGSPHVQEVLLYVITNLTQLSSPSTSPALLPQYPLPGLRYSTLYFNETLITERYQSLWGSLRGSVSKR